MSDLAQQALTRARDYRKTDPKLWRGNKDLEHRAQVGLLFLYFCCLLIRLIVWIPNQPLISELSSLTTNVTSHTLTKVTRRLPSAKGHYIRVHRIRNDIESTVSKIYFHRPLVQFWGLGLEQRTFYIWSLIYGDWNNVIIICINCF